MSYGILDNNPSSYNNEEYLARNEAQRHIRQLEKGLVVTVVNSRKKICERLTLRPNRHTKELLCLRCETAPPEAAISLREIQEVRHGKEGPDFEKLCEETRNYPDALCVAILYGTEFVLSSLSFLTDNSGEFEVLTKGLKQLMVEVKEGTYHDEKAAWLHGQFYKVLKLDSHWVSPGAELTAKLSDVKLWMAKSWKMKPKEIKKVVHECRYGDKVNFCHFSDMFQKAAHAEKIISEHFKYYMEKEDKQMKMYLDKFKEFLKKEQQEVRGDVEQKAIMAKWVEDSLREVNGLHFCADEFEDFIFSQENSIWNPAESRVNQAMTHPLCDYFIASSHNTYVSGTSQWTGESSVEAYVRALLMGCRCVELDCFDGPDGPIITHGKTMMTSIKAIDVLHAIRKYAWKTSEYPVILSIENHMSVETQKVFAQQMKDTFKEMLLTKPLDSRGNKMPSPHDLRRKIIIKDKKFGIDPSADMDKDDHRAGMVEVYDTEEGLWVQHSAVLTYTALMLSKVRKEDVSAQSISEEDLELSDIEDDLDEDVVTQPWFHGRLEKAAVKEKLEPNAAMMGDGYFLVRESANSDGYTVSFWYNKEIKHARITTKEVSDGSRLFSLGSNEFPHVKDLIEYHREHELVLTRNIRVVLKDHCPFFPDYTTQEWFFEHLTRTEADALLQASKDGNFLVRPGSDASTFSISVRNDAKIRHFQIVREGRRFTLGNYQFSSMVKLVEFFRKRPIAHNLVLGEPLQRDLLGEADMACKIYDSNVYSDPQACGDAKVIVRALFDFTTKIPDHLSFKRGAIIYNVTTDDSLWWRGELGGETGLFPARNVEVVRHVDEEEEETITLALDTLDTDTPRHHQGRENVIRVSHPSLTIPLYLGCLSTLDLRNWLVDIGYCRDLLNKKRSALEQQSTQFQRALEWSELIIYCRSVKIKSSEGEKGEPGECVSMKDSEIKDYMKGDKQTSLIKHNQRHLSRVYPSSGPIRLTQSTNYDPMPCWNLGCQMVALNYQTFDIHMQRNIGFFTRNGRSGYVLKPECMRKPGYNLNSCLDDESVLMTIKVLAGRLLGAMSVFVEMQVTGVELQEAAVRTSKNSGGNALHVQWEQETHEFNISFRELALLRLEVKSEQSEQSLGQACIPVASIRPGFRSVPLLYPSGDPMGLPALLVHVSFKYIQASEEANVQNVIKELRKELASLEKHSRDSKRYQQLKDAEQNMLSYLEKRSQRKKSVGVRK